MLYHLSYSRSTVVGRGGFEPPKALRQQIYSLPRLATSVPARFVPLNEHRRPRVPTPRQIYNQELAEGLEPPTCSLQVSCSTS